MGPFAEQRECELWIVHEKCFKLIKMCHILVLTTNNTYKTIKGSIA